MVEKISLNEIFIRCRCHLVVNEFRYHRLHRVFRNPSRDGGAHLQDPVVDAGQHRHVATSSLSAHVQRAVQQSHGGVRRQQTQSKQHHVRPLNLVI